MDISIVHPTIVVIFNASFQQWAFFEASKSKSKRSLYSPFISFEAAWYATLRLISTMATGWYNAKIVLLALCDTECRLIWETSGTMQELFSVEALTKRLHDFLKKVDTRTSRDPLISLGLAKACCIIHARAKRTAQHFQFLYSHPSAASSLSDVTNRIILLDIGMSRYADQYAHLANIGLVAQEQNICIDVCDIGPPAVAMLKHLVSLTQGIYLSFFFSVSEQIKEDQIKGTSPLLKLLGQDAAKDEEILSRMFVSFLLFHYSVPPEARKFLPTGHTNTESCSAVCRCHHQPVDIGLVCSCCLAIFCYEYKDPICAVCRVRFKKERNVTLATARLVKKPFMAIQSAAESSKDVVVKQNVQEKAVDPVLNEKT